MLPDLCCFHCSVVALGSCGSDTSTFELQASGQIKASRDGDVCLALAGNAPNYVVTAIGCGDAAQRAVARDKFSACVAKLKNSSMKSCGACVLSMQGSRWRVQPERRRQRVQ